MKFAALPLAGKPVDEQVKMVSEAATKDPELLNDPAAHAWMMADFDAIAAVLNVRGWDYLRREQPPAP